MKTPSAYSHAKFLIVDDQSDNIELLERILGRGGYSNLRTLMSPRKFLDFYQEYQPDIILMDLHMPEMDGLDLLQVLQPLIPRSSFVPVLMLTADITTKAKREALLAGANDFLTKPFDTTEVLLRIHNLLQIRFLHLEVQQHNQILEERVKERTRDLEEAQITLLDCLAKASEFRDDDTGEHTQRVGQLSAKLAEALGLSRNDTETIGLAAQLHDIGKIGIPDHILLKPGHLTQEEFDRMKLHTLIGEEIVSSASFPVLKLARTIARTHHERWDGSGYPSGLKGDEIPLEGQIVAIIDVFDALTHQRPYKRAWSVEEAIGEIKQQSGKQFNPGIVSAFEQVMIQMEYTKHIDDTGVRH